MVNVGRFLQAAFQSAIAHVRPWSISLLCPRPTLRPMASAAIADKQARDMIESGSVLADGSLFPRVSYRKMHDVPDSLVMFRCWECVDRFQICRLFRPFKQKHNFDFINLEDDKGRICTQNSSPLATFSWRPFVFSIFLTSGAAVIAFSILDSTLVERQPGEVKRDSSMKTAKDNIPHALRITISYVLQSRLAPISSSDCRHQSPADAVLENINLRLLLLLLFICMNVRA